MAPDFLFAPTPMNVQRVYNSFGFCCGLGGGAKGFTKATSHVGNMTATWRCIGGIDNDPAAARDFETLVGTPCTVYLIGTARTSVAPMQCGTRPE